MARPQPLLPSHTPQISELLPEGPRQYELPLGIRKAIRELPTSAETEKSWSEISSILHRFLSPEQADAYFDALLGISAMPTLDQKREKLLELVRSHSPHTYEHSLNVRRLAEAGEGMFDADMHTVATALELHDIGKIAVQPEVIEKPGKYEDADWEQMKLHPILSGHLLDVMGFDFLTRQIGWYHHLRTKQTPSGKIRIVGYPSVEIKSLSEEVRIASLFDVYDALTSQNRPTKRKFEEGESEATQNYTPAEALDLMRTRIFADPTYKTLLDAFEKTINPN